MASARDAFQRQRAREHGRIEHGLRQNMLHGLRLQELEHQFEREGVLLGERNVDAVVGGGGLQLEIERAAEALAQRQSPGPIDARSERRVDHQLHPAAFIEEALGDHGLLRRQGVERRRARQHISDGLLGAAFIQRRNRPSGTASRDLAPMRDAISSRTSPTASDSSSVRPGASPSQNGTEGGAPCASSTRTRPGSTRLMRQELVPSRNTSPARLSTAKSSSTVPTALPSGSATTE